MPSIATLSVPTVARLLLVVSAALAFCAVATLAGAPDPTHVDPPAAGLSVVVVG